MIFGITSKAIVVWFGILVIAIVNGVFRDAVFIPVLGEVPGLILSGVLLSVLIFAISYFMLPWIGPATSKECFVIGLEWLFLTIFFEFIFGILIQGDSLSDLLEAYTFKGGNVWPIVVLVTVISPYIATKIRAWREKGSA